MLDEPVKEFERRYHGVDWGWYLDLWAFNCTGGDPLNENIQAVQPLEGFLMVPCMVLLGLLDLVRKH